MTKAPGKSFREGVSLIELMDLFPTEKAATKWFEAQVWPDGRHCGHCGSVETAEVPNAKPMPYWCKDCRSYFSVRTGTAIARSKVPLRKWAVAIYLCLTSLKSVSSMKLHRDIKVSQPTAWFMLHRLREAWVQEPAVQFAGPVEVDETYIGGKRKNMPKSKRKALKGRGAVGKTAVVGAKDRDTNQVVARWSNIPTPRLCKGLSLPMRHRPRPSTPMTPKRIRGCLSTTKASNTVWASTCATWRTPTGLRASGQP